MPRKSEKIKLSEKQDRRRKLTTEQKQEIIVQLLVMIQLMNQCI